MDDLISIQAAIDAICEHGTDLERRGITVLSVANHKQATVDLLENLPSAERRGKWIGTLMGWRCSVCGEEQDYSVHFKHCQNCGARMEV